MKASRWAAVAVALLVAVALASLLVPWETAPDTKDAWELIAPAQTVHHCEAPVAEAYSARDIHYVHSTATGIAMATPRVSGVNALLGVFEPVGTVSWDPEGCTVSELKTRTVRMEVTDAEAEPAEALIATCAWLPLVATEAGVAEIELPVGARCKIAAIALGETSFRRSPTAQLDDETETYALVIDPEDVDIETHRDQIRGILAHLASRPTKNAYDKAMQRAEGDALIALGLWKAEYRQRQKRTLERLEALAADDSEWVQLIR